MITLVQSFKSPSNKNIGNTLNINTHITNKPITIKDQTHMNYLLMEKVLFEKLHNIKLLRSVFRVTTFCQFDSTKSTLNTLLKYAKELDENMKTLYLKLVTNNNYNHKLYDANQWSLSYSALLTSCCDEISDFKLQIADINIQLNNIFTTLNQSKHNHTKMGIIHSLFNFLFGTSSSAEEITAIKNNMKILKGNQDI